MGTGGDVLEIRSRFSIVIYEISNIEFGNIVQQNRGGPYNEHIGRRFPYFCWNT
jgi:hypothetical protein